MQENVRFKIFSFACIVVQLVFVDLSIFTKLNKSFPNFYPGVILCCLRWRKVFNFDWFFPLFCRQQIINGFKRIQISKFVAIFKSFQLFRQILISGKMWNICRMIIIWWNWRGQPRVPSSPGLSWHRKVQIAACYIVDIVQVAKHIIGDTAGHTGCTAH